MPRRIAMAPGTAVHEAAHVVVAMVLDVPVRYASMRPSDVDAVAHVQYGRFKETASTAERCMVVAAAGLAAEDLYHRGYGRGYHSGGREDLVDAARDDLRAVATCAANIDSAFDHYIGTMRPSAVLGDAAATTEWAWREAVALVHRHWLPVAAVAGVLHCAPRAVYANQLRQAMDEGEPAWFVRQPRRGWQATPRRRDLTFWPGRYIDLSDALRASA